MVSKLNSKESKNINTKNIKMDQNNKNAKCLMICITKLICLVILTSIFIYSIVPNQSGKIAWLTLSIFGTLAAAYIFILKLILGIKKQCLMCLVVAFIMGIVTIIEIWWFIRDAMVVANVEFPDNLTAVMTAFNFPCLAISITLLFETIIHHIIVINKPK